MIIEQWKQMEKDKDKEAANIQKDTRLVAHVEEQEHLLRQLAVLNDIFFTLVLETTPEGLLQRLLEGGSYITRAEFGVASCIFPDGAKYFAQVGLRLTEKEAGKVGDLLPTLFQSSSRLSSRVKIYQDTEAADSIHLISPLLPPVGSFRAMSLFMGERQIGLILLCHSRADFNFMKGESTLLQLVVQGGLMAERFDLFREIEKKSKDLEEANARLAQVLAESEEKNQQLKEANEAIEQSKAELESFVYSASHDLKAPVVSLHGLASMLLEDYGERLDPQGKHYLHRLLSNASFMEQLISDLLEFSRIGRKECKAEKLDAEKVIQDVLDQCYSKIRERKTQIRIYSPLPDVVFDPTHLSQIFLNFITNAIKFMGDQPNPRVEIGGREIDGFVEFYVKDNGIGINPEYQDLIFGVFQRLKEVEVEGTGIGLAIVKKIIDLAGGKVWLESKKGEGTTFFFRLPK